VDTIRDEIFINTFQYHFTKISLVNKRFNLLSEAYKVAIFFIL